MRLNELNKCTIKLINEHAVKFIFSGDVAIFPSTSNSKAIYRKKIGNKVVPFIGKKSEHQAKLEAITWAYRAEINRLGISDISFGSDLVFSLAFIAHQPRRYDSHNYAKPICDWLQSVGIVDDDTAIEMHVRKAVEYQHHNFNCQETTIYLLRKVFIGGLLGRQLTEILDITDRGSKLVG